VSLGIDLTSAYMGLALDNSNGESHAYRECSINPSPSQLPSIQGNKEEHCSDYQLKVWWS